ncbi:unnamed protein product [Candidula unifasciata]|uniref:DNA-repair protein Xrcc1 N-terminal domain-containing protein n=1 Tax=Candidula unifasciata TaxID=100452 RepID=A0A8S3ZW79_9EUPU|nr:unnamed protein product [Candidula unifasciata]
MAPVNIKFIVSFSSQDDCHKASNLIASDGSKVWLSNRKDTSGKSEVILQLEKPCQLAYLDIGAVWCATLEVRVGRSDWPQTQEYKLLIPTYMLMSPLDCRLSRGFKSTQMFSKSKSILLRKQHVELWDRLHIICRQPHRRDVQLGLSFIHIRDAVMVAPPGISSPSVSGASPLSKSAINTSSIQKHFFGDMNKTQHRVTYTSATFIVHFCSPTDRLKYRLMKMAGSTENGCEQEQGLSRTAKLVLKASENQKSYSPQRVSPVPRKGLFSEHVTEEMKSFLQTLNVTAADIDKVTIAATKTISSKLSNEPIKTSSDGMIQKTPIRKRTSQVKKTEPVHQKDMTALPTTEFTMLNTFSNQCGWKESSTVAASIEANEYRSKILTPPHSLFVEDGQIFAGEKHKEDLHHLNIAKKDLSSPQQKLSLKMSFSSSCQNLHTHKEKQMRSKGDAVSHSSTDNAEKDNDSISSLSYDGDAHEMDKSEAVSPCPSPCRKDVTTEGVNKPATEGVNKPTTEGVNKPYENIDLDKTPVSYSSSKPAKLKRLSKASFDIFQEFSMEIMNDDGESTCDVDDIKFDSSASKRESFHSESEKGDISLVDNSSFNVAKIVNNNSGKITPPKLKSHINETGLMKKTPKSAKGKIYRMHTSRNKLNVSETKHSSDLQQTYKLSDRLPISHDVDRLDTRMNQNCLEYLGSCNSDKYVPSPNKIRKSQTMSVRATELSTPTFHSTPGNKWIKTKSNKNPGVSVPSTYTSDRSSQSQYPADVIPAHRAFCTPVRLGSAAAVWTSPDELLIDEAATFAECPICLQRFPQDVLLVHASECGA